MRAPQPEVLPLPEVREAEFGEHVGRPAIVPSAARSPNRSTGACPTALFMFDRGLWTSQAPAAVTRAMSCADRCTPCASTGALVEQAVPLEPIDDAAPVHPPRAQFVVLRFRGVDVDADAVVSREVAEGGEARIAQRE